MNKLSDSLEQTISELKTANNELQRDIEKKDQVDEMRKEFLANVSHELKTPIALIQGYAEGLQEGDVVQAGDLIGYMGRTGYSDKENVNNIETVHLHFGMQLIFDESQKECLSEIWIDVYDIVRLLNEHRSSIRKNGDCWERVYPYQDLDMSEFSPESS